MGLFKKKNVPQGYESDGYYTEEVTEPIEVEESETKDSTSLELKVLKPQNFQEVTDIADYLMGGYTVFLNMEETERSVAKRILDFLTGVSYAIHYQLKKVSEQTFILSSQDVDVSDQVQVQES